MCGSRGMRPCQHYPGLWFSHRAAPPPTLSVQSGDILPWSALDFKNGYFGPQRSHVYCLRGVGDERGGAVSPFVSFSEKCRGSGQRSAMSDLRLYVTSLACRRYRFWAARLNINIALYHQHMAKRCLCATRSSTSRPSVSTLCNHPAWQQCFRLCHNLVSTLKVAGADKATIVKLFFLMKWKVIRRQIMVCFIFLWFFSLQRIVCYFQKLSFFSISMLNIKCWACLIGNIPFALNNENKSESTLSTSSARWLNLSSSELALY